MQDNHVDIQLHVNISMLYADINKLNGNIIMLRVDINNTSYMYGAEVCHHKHEYLKRTSFNNYKHFSIIVFLSEDMVVALNWKKNHKIRGFIKKKCMAAVSFNIIKQYDKDYVTEYLSSCIES